MSGAKDFLDRLETISELLVPEWRSIAPNTFPRIEPLLDINKLLEMDARHNLQEILGASKLDQSEQELIKFKKHKLHQSKALKKYRQKCEKHSTSQESDLDQLIRQRDELFEYKRQLIWEKIYFQTMLDQFK